MLTEKEKLQRARWYLLLLCRGIDPITQEPVSETTLQNERIVKCFGYVCRALDQQIAVYDRQERQQVRRKASGQKKKAPFYLTEEEQARVCLPQGDCLPSELVSAVNAVIEGAERKKLQVKHINQWLEHQGYLTKKTDGRGREHRAPTPSAAEIGLTARTGIGAYGEYPIVIYSEKTQRYVLAHLQEITDFMEKEV